MKLYIIACRVFYREISRAAALSPNMTEISWMAQGLHEDPKTMPGFLQQEIDRIEAAAEAGELRFHPDAIVLGYGLCSNGTAGLHSRTIPLIVPRTDDCIALFLGSQKRYLELFQRKPGTYWVNGGWLEEAKLPSPESYQEMRAQFVEDYGEENADFLMESGIGWGWVKNYQSCGYIRPTGIELPEWRQEAQKFADNFGWEMFETEGSDRLFDKLLAGDWDEEEFLVCPPGYATEPTGDKRKLIAVLPNA